VQVAPHLAQTETRLFLCDRLIRTSTASPGSEAVPPAVTRPAAALTSTRGGPPPTSLLPGLGVHLSTRRSPTVLEPSLRSGAVLTHVVTH
jgi:hypothetical protein